VSLLVSQVTQFGYVAFFGVSFPLAALVCMLHTMLRLRSNALRLTQLSRRPRPQAVDGVGLWATLLFFEAHVIALNSMTSTPRFSAYEKE